MKNSYIIVLTLALLSALENAAVTFILSDELEVPDGKIYVYENAMGSEKVAASAQCHHIMTFY